ncbi:nuclear body protein SP140-like protein isoform X5 [Oncorhynchus tshawytscha]|uniref:Nuclear body protein SP140-like protein n=1 Tax=Oncorhynchus tshawytscha TaxID=74940 RepID=A0A8C8GAQ9_ONCTS|nr:nuclear body protein SP140-like protein isoform X5 [Oncorhynchus tshawytscha]
MDPLDFLTDEELLRFFRCSRTEMSCMEQPHTFLNQLRDHHLIPEEMYKKLIRCKSKEVREKGVYQVLDWVEAERPNSIKVFWNCVFRDHLLQQYPTLRLLRNRLLDGSFTFYEKLPKKVEKDEEEEDKKKASEEGKDGEEEEEKEEEEVKTRKNSKEKERSESAEEEQPSTSTQSNPSQKRKVQSPTNCFPSRKGEKDDIWTWPIYKTQLPVTCGDKEGILIRNKLAKESEEDDDEEEEDEVAEEAEQEREEGEREEQANTAEGGSRKGGSHGAVKKSVFKVTCGDINGMLHKDRFASGLCGKSIRTELRWMTPVEFVKGESALEDPSWKNDIRWDGKPLNLLIKSKILVIHSLLCKCKLCSSTAKDRDNDDDCFICRSQGSLICCDECPRSFHQRCHLPNVDDAMLGDDRPWLCTFCVLRASQSWSYPTQMTYQEALTCRISDHPLECQYLLLCLYHADEDHIFVKDPCINVRNYTSEIKTPIWLDRVVEKLQQNLYQSVQQFVSDVLLIFTNCATFNRDNAEFRVMGERLKDLFEREFKSTFSIQLQHPTASNSQ